MDPDPMPTDGTAAPPARAERRPAPRPSPGQAGPQAQRPPEPRRRKPSATERRYAGFGDETDRAYCAAYAHAVPLAFPVQGRTGVATLRVRAVARRPGALLLCDGAHDGPHLWPLGDLVEEDERVGE